MTVERKQQRLADIDEAITRWQKRLFRAARELDKLVKQRKRLLAPARPGKLKDANWTPDKYVGSSGLDDDLRGI